MRHGTMAGRRRLEGEPAPVYGKCRKLGVVVHGFDAWIGLLGQSTEL